MRTATQSDRASSDPVCYHSLITAISVQIQEIEQALARDRCRSLKDCMFRMHAQWESLRTEYVGLVDQVRTTRAVGAEYGQVDIRPIKAELVGIVAEACQFLVRLSEFPEVMTRAQAIAHRDRH